MKKKLLLLPLLFLVAVFSVSAALTDNLVNYYTLDEPSSPKDSTGRANLTSNYSVYQANGKINHSYTNFTYAGTPEYLTNGVYYAFGSNITINIWLNQTEFNSSLQYTPLIQTEPNTANANWGFVIYNNKIQWYREATRFLVSDDISGVINKWTMITLVHHSNNTVDAYVNGVLNGSAATTDIGTQTDRYVFMGDMGGAGYGFVGGGIDEVGLWSRPLSSSEITSLYNAGNGLAYPFTTNTINLSSVSPENQTYSNISTPLFTFNVTNIVGTWNATLYVGGVSRGSNDSITSTGVYTITSSALSTGTEYEWYVRAVSGTYSGSTENRSLYVTGNVSGVTCLGNLGAAFYRPNNCLGV